jgi:hypothetical protein
MKTPTLFGLATFLLTLSLPAFAHDHNPQALSDLIETVKQEKAEGKNPVVMFDLDDTTINTRERTLRIIQQFAHQPQASALSADVLSKLASIDANDVQFSLADTLKSRGLQDPALAKSLQDFWLTKFFTNELCAGDQQNPGAARYARELVRAGAKVVYLTGRDAPRMHDGTVASLIKNGFPTQASMAVLIMKPDASMDDLKFKESQYATVAAMGHVVGAFENEPANINSMADAFPDAAAIFLDTIHSATSIVPEPRVQWVLDFAHPDAYGSESSGALGAAAAQEPVAALAISAY